MTAGCGCIRCESVASCYTCMVLVMPQIGPGLRVSRSLGDQVAATCGVIAEPELSHHKLTSDDRFLIVASDGLWSVRVCSVEVVSCQGGGGRGCPPAYTACCRGGVRTCRCENVLCWLCGAQVMSSSEAVAIVWGLLRHKHYFTNNDGHSASDT